MIVAVVAVHMMQMPADEVVHMITVWHSLVPTARPMHVPCIVPAALVRGRASGWVRLIDRYAVLVYMALMGMMQMAVVEIIHVPIMHDCGVAAVGAVLVIVVAVLFAAHLCFLRLDMTSTCHAAR